MRDVHGTETTPTPIGDYEVVPTKNILTDTNGDGVIDNKDTKLAGYHIGIPNTGASNHVVIAAQAGSKVAQEQPDGSIVYVNMPNTTSRVEISRDPKKTTTLAYGHENGINAGTVTYPYSGVTYPRIYTAVRKVDLENTGSNSVLSPNGQIAWIQVIDEAGNEAYYPVNIMLMSKNNNVKVRIENVADSDQPIAAQSVNSTVGTLQYDSYRKIFSEKRNNKVSV